MQKTQRRSKADVLKFLHLYVYKFIQYSIKVTVLTFSISNYDYINIIQNILVNNYNFIENNLGDTYDKYGTADACVMKGGDPVNRNFQTCTQPNQFCVGKVAGVNFVYGLENGKLQFGKDL